MKSLSYTSYSKWIPLTLLALSTAAVAAQPDPKAQEIGGGNGGGGVILNGVPMTFYSAGLIPKALDPMKDIPALEKFIDFVNSATFLNAKTRQILVETVIPSASHEYYAIEAKPISLTTKKRLLEEFKRVTNVDTASIRLFALTDTFTRKTYLLPDFFKLKAHEQMAILFHETYWLISPYDTTYDEVVRIEGVFQAMLENPGRSAPIAKFLELIDDKIGFRSDWRDRLRHAIAADLDEGNLRGLLQSDQKSILLVDLFGREFLDCGAERKCLDYLNIHFFKLQQRFPDSLFLRLLRSKLPTPERPSLLMGLIEDQDEGVVDVSVSEGTMFFPRSCRRDNGEIYHPWGWRFLRHREIEISSNTDVIPGAETIGCVVVTTAKEPASLWMPPLPPPLPPETPVDPDARAKPHRTGRYVLGAQWREPLRGTIELTPIGENAYLPARLSNMLLCVGQQLRTDRRTPGGERDNATQYFPGSVKCEQKTLTFGFTILGQRLER